LTIDIGKMLWQLLVTLLLPFLAGKVSSAAPLVGQSKQKTSLETNQPTNQPANQPANQPLALITDHRPK